MHGLCETLDTEFDVVDYAEHAMVGAPMRPRSRTSRASRADGQIRWGIGTDPNITTASLRAVLSALRAPAPLTRPPSVTGWPSAGCPVRRQRLS